MQPLQNSKVISKQYEVTAFGLELESFPTFEWLNFRGGASVCRQRLRPRAAAEEEEDLEEDLEGGRGSPSVSRRVASLPGVGLRAETLSLPHHRLDHGGGSPLQLRHVVLLDQTLHDALHGVAVTQRRTDGRTEGGRRRRYWSLIGNKVMHLKGQYQSLL